jgi:hypothetical protein
MTNNDYNLHHSTQRGDDAKVGFNKAFGETLGSHVGGCVWAIIVIAAIIIFIALAFVGC